MKFIRINVIESLTNTNEIHPYEETEILFLIFLIRMNYVRIYKLNPLTYINNQTKTMKSNSINGEKDETYLDGGAAPKCRSSMAPKEGEEEAWRRATKEKTTAKKKKKKRNTGWVRVFVFKFKVEAFLSIQVKCWVHQQ